MAQPTRSCRWAQNDWLFGDDGFDRFHGDTGGDRFYFDDENWERELAESDYHEAEGDQHFITSSTTMSENAEIYSEIEDLVPGSVRLQSMTYDLDNTPIPVQTSQLNQDPNEISFLGGTDFDFLASEETATVIITYETQTDEGTESGTLALTITGENDFPNGVDDTAVSLNVPDGHQCDRQ